MPISVEMDQIGALIFIALLLGILLVFYFSPSYTSKIVVAATGPYELNNTSSTTIIEEADSKTFYSETNGSLSAFVYLNPTNRTASYAPCGVNPNEASCSDGTFQLCNCDSVTSDCSICEHVSYNTVFNISGIVWLEALIAPDASRQGKAMAQLVVKTEGPPLNSGAAEDADAEYADAEDADAEDADAEEAPLVSSTSQKYIETLTLPPIPVQKWTYITVAREGRRFDVYFNDSLVLSKKTLNMPISNVSNASGGGITSGSAGLNGQLALVDLYNYRLTSQNVAARYSVLADTRGRPYLNAFGNSMTLSDVAGLAPSYAATMSSGLYNMLPSFNLCPTGGCLNPPPIRAANPLYDWSTPYN